ncbi:MAG: TusE/DsrC/DsvC family sulfur relay protein [Gammaproteobacteria bacterium]|jgi:tRNA 2-thiouridine synthesizing protein E
MEAELMPVERDQYGYLEDPGQWSREMAATLAQAQGIETLTAEHWKVIDYLRQHHLAHGTLPPMEQICHAIGLKDDCIRHLFRGPNRAWIIAGLPNPGEEARTYMLNEEPPE